MLEQAVGLGAVTVLGVLEQAYFSLQVIYARRKYSVSPPATAGPPEFERVFRAHQNIRNQLMSQLLRVLPHLHHGPVDVRSLLQPRSVCRLRVALSLRTLPVLPWIFRVGTGTSGSAVFQRSGSLGSHRVLLSRGSPHLLPGLPERGPAAGARLRPGPGLRDGVRGQRSRHIMMSLDWIDIKPRQLSGFMS